MSVSESDKPRELVDDLTDYVSGMLGRSSFLKKLGAAATGFITGLVAVAPKPARAFQCLGQFICCTASGCGPVECFCFQQPCYGARRLSGCLPGQKTIISALWCCPENGETWLQYTCGSSC